MSVRAEQDGAVLWITLDRPEARNALDGAATRELCAIWERLRDDAGLRVAILTGAGDRSFCAGADLKELAAHYQDLSSWDRRERWERETGLGGLTRTFDPDKPVVCAINGHCLGGGLELALACDIRIAAEHATFGLPEVRRGIIPGAGGTQRLPRLISPGLALELVLTGMPIDAQTALGWGLVNRVVPFAHLHEAAGDLARRIAGNAPLAVRAARAAVRRGLHLPLEDALRLEQAQAELVRGTADAAEGVRAFLERREPEFGGR